MQAFLAATIRALLQTDKDVQLLTETEQDLFRQYCKRILQYNQFLLKQIV